MLVIGVILIVFGLADLFAAGALRRQQAAANPGGLGPGARTPVPGVLRAMGLATIVAGVVLAAIGALS